MTIFLIIIAVLLCIFWLAQIVALMRMSDDQFPGRFDKPIWAAILIFTFVLGAIAFAIWKMTVAAESESKALAEQLTNMVQQTPPSEGRGHTQQGV